VNRGILQRALLVVLVILGSLGSARAEEAFTLEEIMSTPFPSGLTAAAEGGAIAWVQNERGIRNIWTAQPPAYTGKQLTQFSEDDGVALGSLRFSADGNELVFVRGGAPNRQGEIPNPRSEPTARERALWVVSIDGGEVRRRTEGSAPEVSPKGDSLVFLKDNQVWHLSLKGEAEPAQLFQVRGSTRSLTWSPDGQKLAFVSERGDHAFVGVYDLSEKRVCFLDPSVDRDSSPVWSLDGKSVAFIRIPRQSKYLPFMARRESEPWSIRVADASSGKGREIWRASEGQGSVFRGVDARSHLFWGEGDLLVFPWEKDGWTHLYSVPAIGGRAKLLTPGKCEVQHVAFAPSGGEVLFTSNQDDIDRRHVWRVPVSGGNVTAITRGKGIEWAPVMTSNGRAVAYLASDARRPAHARIKIGEQPDRELVPDSLPKGFPVNALVEPQQVIFPAADGMPIHGQLFIPKNLAHGQKAPAVLFFHGGSRRQMMLAWHYRGYYHNAYAFNQFLASRGYVVLSVNYRSGIGYGLKFREALNYGARGASEFNDVLGAGLYLRSRIDVDPERIGLWGGSYGGYLTALGLARASDLFAAGVDLHGVHDWNVVIRNFHVSYDATDNAEVARLAFESSPMASVKDWRSPVLLIHADDDRNVPFSETVDLVEALRENDVELELLIFPDDVHSFLLHRNWIRAYSAAAHFFDRKLRK
jgi:dipeptidyl aminopeptidase/acylaminoacyl peptidase